jgi:hypothetical protein
LSTSTQMPKNTSLQNQLDLIQMAAEVSRAAQVLASDPQLEQMNRLGEILQGLAYPVRKIEFADQREQTMEMIRTFELHGAGWFPFSDHGLAFKTGDLLVTNDLSLCFVTAVDDRGHIQGVAGDGDRKTVAEGQFALVWSPETTARRWLAEGAAAPAYRDLDAAMLYLVRQWGNKQSDNGRDISSVIGFFIDALGAPGVKIDLGDLNEYSTDEEIMQYCAARGMAAIAPSYEPAVGDFLLFKKKTWAIVSRPGKLVDLLLPAQKGKGPLGEPPGALRLARQVALEEFTQVWRPAGKAQARKGLQSR